MEQEIIIMFKKVKGKDLKIGNKVMVEWQCYDTIIDIDTTIAYFENMVMPIYPDKEYTIFCDIFE